MRYGRDKKRHKFLGDNIFCRVSANYNTQTRSNNICRMEKGWPFIKPKISILFKFSFLCVRGKINVTDVTSLRYGRDRSESGIYSTMETRIKCFKTLTETSRGCLIGLLPTKDFSS